MHLTHLSSSCVPSMSLFYESILPENLFDFFFPCKKLTEQKAIEIHLNIVPEELFSLTTLNKILV